MRIGLCNRRRFLFVIAILAAGCGRPPGGTQPVAEAVSLSDTEEEGRETSIVPGPNGSQVVADSHPPIIENVLGVKFVLIPAGEFQMGAPDTDVKARDEEKPQHLVRITQPFYMAVYEVTHAEFELLMNRNPSIFARDGLFAERVAGEDDRRLPVLNVNWNDAVEFCRLLSELPEERAAGRVYRLPTEAEWEYACRAGSRSAYSWGDEIEPADAAFDHEDLGAPFLGRPKPVGTYPPNSFGLHDMHGNAEEWCQDYFDWYYYARSPIEDPVNCEPGQMGDRVLRGGHYHSHPLVLRSSRRESAKPDTQLQRAGIRLVLPAVATPGLSSEGSHR